jgi:tetratricopeptide (TPR) repeat protein
MLAVACLDTAVMLDPSFAEAHAAKSIAHSWMYFYSRRTEFKEISRIAADEALKLAPTLPVAHNAMGTFYNLVETDYDRALEEFNMARSEVHSDSRLLGSIALVQFRKGQFEEATENWRRATELDPLNSFSHEFFSRFLTFTRSYEEAEIAANRAIAIDGTSVANYSTKMRIYGSRYGDLSKQVAVAREALRQCDTLEFLANNWWLNRAMPKLAWDSLLVEFKAKYESNRDRIWYFGSVTTAHYMLGDSALYRTYTDSARMVLEQQLDDNPIDAAERKTDLGALYAALGDCDRAIEFGIDGKESLTIDDCHW